MLPSSETSTPFEIDFFRLASYWPKNKSSGEITLTKDIELSVKGKSVIIIEDIIDIGLTLSYQVRHIKERGPESAKICALVNRSERREKEIEIGCWGFKIKGDFLVGYGLDQNERFRYLPYILSLETKD